MDSRTGEQIVRVIASLVHSEGIAAVVATHDAAVTAAADRVYELSDGRFVDSYPEG